MFSRLRTFFTEYPRQFWMLMLASLIDNLGSMMIFVFFSLYLSQKFDVSLAQIGLSLATWAFFSQIGGAVGGALTDRFGRKRMIIFGLVFSALSSLALLLANDFSVVYLAAAFGGLFSAVGGPANGAMIADLLPKEKYADGFGIQRVVGNIAFTIGPGLGGLLASISFSLMFAIDIATSLITALFVYLIIQESRPPDENPDAPLESLAQTFRGYLTVLQDKVLLIIIAFGTLVGIAYQQWYFALPLFMRDVHGMPPHFYGSMMSMAGILVILLQIPLTRRLRGVAMSIQMAAGAFVFLLGFGMFAFITPYALFLLASAIITLGEMLYFPAQNAAVAVLAPQAMRGRYMATAGLIFSISNMLGPVLGGLILDQGDPRQVWIFAAMLLAIPTLGYLALRHRFPQPPDA